MKFITLVNLHPTKEVHSVIFQKSFNNRYLWIPFFKEKSKINGSPYRVNYKIKQSCQEKQRLFTQKQMKLQL